jgi:hypothetical protein
MGARKLRERHPGTRFNVNVWCRHSARPCWMPVKRYDLFKVASAKKGVRVARRLDLPGAAHVAFDNAVLLCERHAQPVLSAPNAHRIALLKGQRVWAFGNAVAVRANVESSLRDA